MIRWMHRLVQKFQSLEPIEKTIMGLATLAGIAIAMALSITVAFVSYSASQHSDSTSTKANNAAAQAAAVAKAAQDATQADCGTWRDLSTIPPAATASPSGLQLYADFRTSYLKKGCIAVLGKLPPADPRIAPLVPAAVK